MLSGRLIRGRTQTKQADTIILAQSLSSQKKIPTHPPFRGCWGRGKNLLRFPLEKKEGGGGVGKKKKKSLPAAFSEWEVKLVFPAWRSLEVARLRLWCEEKSCFLCNSGGTRQSGHLGGLLFPGTSAGLGIRCEEITRKSLVADWVGRQMYHLQKSTWR